MPNPQYSPAALVVDLGELLSTKLATHIEIDSAKCTDGFIAAALLLRAYGIQPVVDKDDLSAAADAVRDMVLIVTYFKTRSRRDI